MYFVGMYVGYYIPSNILGGNPLGYSLGQLNNGVGIPIRGGCILLTDSLFIPQLDLHKSLLPNPHCTGFIDDVALEMIKENMVQDTL